MDRELETDSRHSNNLCLQSQAKLEDGQAPKCPLLAFCRVVLSSTECHTRCPRRRKNKRVTGVAVLALAQAHREPKRVTPVLKKKQQKIRVDDKLQINGCP